MNVDTGAFRALVEDVEAIKQHLAAQDMLSQILAGDLRSGLEEAAGIPQLPHSLAAGGAATCASWTEASRELRRP